MVLRTPAGSGTGAAAQHSQSLEAWFIHSPGLKVVMPSTPYDAKGLLVASIRDGNPVIFVEQKLLYRQKGPVPEELYSVPLSVAEVKREGRDLTIVATGVMVSRSLAAAEQLAREDIEVEVVDLALFHHGRGPRLGGEAELILLRIGNDPLIGKQPGRSILLPVHRQKERGEHCSRDEKRECRCDALPRREVFQAERPNDE